MARATRRLPTRSDDGTPRPSRPGSAASTATGSRPCGRAMGGARGSALGLTASKPPGGHGGGARIRYGADAQQRILAEWARTPQREPDGTATWSLSLLQKALRKAPDGLPRVSTYTIWRTLHEAGLSWQKSRTWCETGIAMRTRKHGVVRVSDPDAAVKRG